jgi:chemotaxis response regulator CheB
LKKIRVLVVDDSALVRSLLTEIINRQKDMECVGAANDPLIAREMIRELNPDVLTLDIEMPKMDGITMSKRLRELNIDVPIIFLTNMGDLKHISSAVETASEYIIKSDVNAEGIANRVKQRLNK